MRVGSLFAGIGGFDLAAEWMGWRTIWVSEIDPFASAVLAKHFPHAPNLGDITAIDWSAVERPDILCGGFPCQPHSTSGERKASADERDLWGECARAVRGLRPRYAVLENVTGLFSSERGGFFNGVLSDLADLGYDAEWAVLSACAVGAPHPRERVWIIAYPERRDVSELGLRPREVSSAGAKAPDRSVYGGDYGVGWPPESRVLRGDYGVSDGAHRLKALGNAIVPQCAVEGPFRRILELEEGR